MKVLFLSHNPHEVHLEFARSVNAKVKIIHLNWFIKLTKRIYFLNYLYPIISLFYSFFIGIKEDFILVDGGSSLYLAAFLKARYPHLKIIMLDGDLFFYGLKGVLLKGHLNRLPIFFYNKIDAIISVSEQNKQKAGKYVNVPILVSVPYPKSTKRIGVERKNYGLYVGRLDPDKNIKRIVDFGLQCPYFEKFIVVGDGTQRGYIKKLSESNPKLIYTGQRKDVNKFYSECKFLVHIPDYDPHPCTTMEAALCGCFPIISEGTGTKYLFNRQFLIKNPGDFESINKKVEYMLKNEKRFRELLKSSTKKFPSKKDCVESFKHNFHKLANTIKSDYEQK
jgi:glycosyltransferase involved in cell wall biosynthesis